MLIRTLRADAGRKVKARPAFYPAGIVITSPVVRQVTYSQMNAYRITVVHEQNHFVQATRVMERHVQVSQ